MLYPLAASSLLGGPLGRSSFAPVTEPPTANLWAWWKADSLVGLADGDPVSAWADSGPGARGLSQSGTLRPLYRTGAISGKPAVEFDGVDDHLLLDTPSALTQAHVFLVANLTDATGTDKTITGGSNNAFCYQFRQNTRLPALSAYGFTLVSGSAAPAAAAWFQSNVSLDGAGLATHRLNRTANGSGTVTPATSGSILRIGDVGAFGPRCWKGRIAELLIYSAAISPAMVEAYLNWKYGV